MNNINRNMPYMSSCIKDRVKVYNKYRSGKVKTSRKVKFEVKVMGTLANEIERYIKSMLALSLDGSLEIKRNDLAEFFMCVPSQINYVLETRFKNEQGYYVESRRGGGGYIKIIKVGVKEDEDLLNMVNSTEGKRITQKKGEELIKRLEEEGYLTKREGIILKAIIDRNTLALELPDRDLIRGRILKTLLNCLLRDDFEGGDLYAL
ncbi:MAG: CtsR family transcriptional regulator [Bacillota bacterium]|jgi:transcriptional regulator CtsR